MPLAQSSTPSHIPSIVQPVSPQVASTRIATACTATGHAAFRRDLTIAVLEEILWYIECLIRGECFDLHFPFFLCFDAIGAWTAARSHI